MMKYKGHTEKCKLSLIRLVQLDRLGNKGQNYTPTPLLNKALMAADEFGFGELSLENIQIKRVTYIAYENPTLNFYNLTFEEFNELGRPMEVDITIKFEPK